MVRLSVVSIMGAKSKHILAALFLIVSFSEIQIIQWATKVLETVEGEMSLKYAKRAKCLNTFVFYCLKVKNCNFMETRHCVTWIPTQDILI